MPRVKLPSALWASGLGKTGTPGLPVRFMQPPPPRAPFLGTGVAVGLSSVRLFLRFPATGWSGSRTLSRELRAHMCAFPRTVARPHSQEGALSPSEAALRGSLAAAPQTPLRVLTLTFPQSPD